MLLLLQRIFSEVPDAIVFNCGPLTIDASLVLETLLVGPGFSL